MSRVFFSDLHLQSEQEPKYQAFRRVLQEAQQRQDAVYILGDLVEVWIGDDDDSSFARTLIHDLRDCSEQSPCTSCTEIAIFCIARDLANKPTPFCCRIRFCLKRMICLSRCFLPMVMRTAQAIWLTCKHARWFRSQDWQDQFLASSLDERRTVAQTLREHSKKANQLKAANITDVVDMEIERDLQDRNCRRMIHGHTHRPGIHALNHGAERYVLGDWTSCGWLLRQSDAEFQLERFAITS